jgi:tRNA(Arg) A34 adenosine deaminase TadA
MAPTTATERDARHLRRTFELAATARGMTSPNPLVGAVVVKGGRIISEGWNRVTSRNDPTAHAEIVAIRAAARRLRSFSLRDCVLYTSCEPCPMCLSAAYWARIERVYYGNCRSDAARIEFDDDFLYRELAVAAEERALPAVRLLADEARTVFDEWASKIDKTRY